MLTPRLGFEVIGTARGKGSPTAHGIVRKDGSIVRRRGSHMPLVVVHEDEKSTAWQSTVANGAMVARQRAGLGVLVDVPLAVTIRFYRVRPSGHFGTGRNAGLVKASAPRWPAVKPDVDKLVRNILDAMTGVVYRDDGQVVQLVTQKLYCGTDESPGVVVEVAELAGLPLELGHAEQLSLLAAPVLSAA